MGKNRKTPGLTALLLAAVLAAGLLLARPAAAACLAGDGETRCLVPVGQTVGLRLYAPGVLVVGFAGDGDTPAERCGLETGDLITGIDETPVRSIEEVSAALDASGEDTVTIAALRGGRRVTLELSGVAEEDGSGRQLGTWVRDSMAGIGTVTWYDPETGRFAALGHGVADADTGVLFPFRDGDVLSAGVTGIVKGSAGTPGQLHGRFAADTPLGALSANTEGGVFGTAEEGSFPGEAIPVAARSEVSPGKATILCSVTGEVEEYEVELLRVYPEALSETRNLLLRVTDPRLLEETGGIVQGMSGSPILQNGKLVGAVTHVLLDDPTRGYGILAETMLRFGE